MYSADITVKYRTPSDIDLTLAKLRADFDDEEYSVNQTGDLTCRFLVNLDPDCCDIAESYDLFFRHINDAKPFFIEHGRKNTEPCDFEKDVYDWSWATPLAIGLRNRENDWRRQQHG